MSMTRTIAFVVTNILKFKMHIGNLANDMEHIFAICGVASTVPIWHSLYADFNFHWLVTYQNLEMYTVLSLTYCWWDNGNSQIQTQEKPVI